MSAEVQITNVPALVQFVYNLKDELGQDIAYPYGAEIEYTPAQRNANGRHVKREGAKTKSVIVLFPEDVATIYASEDGWVIMRVRQIRHGVVPSNLGSALLLSRVDGPWSEESAFQAFVAKPVAIKPPKVIPFSGQLPGVYVDDTLADTDQ